MPSRCRRVESGPGRLPLQLKEKHGIVKLKRGTCPGGDGLQAEDELAADKAAVTGVLRDYFRTRQDVALAFLFGSVAKGKATKRSDVDVAVYFSTPYDVQKLRKLSGELENLLHKDVDLIVLNDANPSLAWSALRGIPLRIADRGFYLEYMLDVSREAEDFREFIFDLWRLRQERRQRQSQDVG
ncbi:MAG TPA: nucleotidyltransferase domain-containing protein [Firmicutes bacterium]|nr:nucleotidyltransferase domain-containing protein [Bacillota bacterium]